MNNKIIDKNLIQPCPKNKKNAACSGVVNGMCEVNYNKYCIFYLKVLNVTTKIK
jgi:hypothetical protein